VNVYLDDNATIIDVELPGKTAKDVDLTLDAQSVVISDKPADMVDEHGKPTNVKPDWSRRVELPFRVDHDKANAKFINGILRIELPRADAVASHRIKIG
jgi:HSP20 family protein